MSFTVADIDDFVRLLRMNPEWRDAVRREVLSDELLALPDRVSRMAESLDRLEAATARNSEDIRQNSADIRALQAVVAQNSEDIRKNSEDIRQNSRDIQALGLEIKDLARAIGALGNRTGNLEGSLAELDWSRHFSGRFGTYIRRARLVNAADLTLFEEADEAGTITEEQALGIRRLDLIIDGTIGRGADRRRILLAVEVSLSIDRDDIRRAADRAATLRAVGYDSVGAVAGASISPYDLEDCKRRGVQVFLNRGRGSGDDEPEDVTAA